MPRQERVPPIPEVDQSGYLEDLEQLVLNSQFRWYFEYLEERMYRNGYTNLYDVMAAWFLYSRGFRVQTRWGTGELVLNTNRVSNADWLSIQRTYRQLHPPDSNPYKRQRRL